jgi:hypothetical protein
MSNIISAKLRRFKVAGDWRACDDYEGCNCADVVRLNFERER